MTSGKNWNNRNNLFGNNNNVDVDIGDTIITEDQFQAYIEGLSDDQVNQIAGDYFSNLDTEGLPKLPDQIFFDTDIDGMLSYQDRQQVNKNRLEQKRSQGRQGTILGGGVPTAPTQVKPPSSVLGM